MKKSAKSQKAGAKREQPRRALSEDVAAIMKRLEGLHPSESERVLKACLFLNGKSDPAFAVPRASEPIFL